VDFPLPVIPELDVLPLERTTHQSLASIPFDESTNVGNAEILDNIFRSQYKPEEEVFNNGLFLIYGDQKIVARIRSLKRRRCEAAKPYDSLKWALPVPALFHLRMNHLYMISRNHFGAAKSDSKSTLYWAMNALSRRRIAREKSDFFALEELVTHSFQARICAQRF
jgi:hypothetical protein